MPVPAPEALRSCADMPGRTLQETVAKAGGIRSGSARKDVPDGCPGKRNRPFIRFLGREYGHHALLFRKGTRFFIRPFRTFRTERRLYFSHSRDL